MTDVHSKEVRSKNMAAIHGENTKAELLLFNLVKPLWHEGYRYRRHYRKVVGKPDLAFPAQRLAVFMDSEFWHGKDFGKWGQRLPSEFWTKKIMRNIERDKEVTESLELEGWQVLRFWIKDFIKDKEAVILEIVTILKSR